MDYSKRNKTRAYPNRHFHHYTEGDNYPRRIRRPVAVLLIVVIILFYLLAWNMFGN